MKPQIRINSKLLCTHYLMLNIIVLVSIWRYQLARKISAFISYSDENEISTFYKKKQNMKHIW